MSRPPINDTNKTAGLVNLGPIYSKAPVAAFNVEQVFNLLETKGIQCFHYKHAPNPDRETLEMGVNVNNQAAHRGAIYYEVRELKTVPQSFKLEDRLTVQGLFGLLALAVLEQGNPA